MKVTNHELTKKHYDQIRCTNAQSIWAMHEQNYDPLLTKKSFKELRHQFSIMSLRNSPRIVNSHEVSN